VPALWNAKPIPLGSVSNFNPRNIRHIPMVFGEPATSSIESLSRTVKTFAFLELEQN